MMSKGGMIKKNNKPKMMSKGGMIKNNKPKMMSKGGTVKKDKMKINWTELTEFYLWAILFLSIMYLGWKAARKKTENMIKEERAKKAPKKAKRKTASKKQSKRKR